MAVVTVEAIGMERSRLDMVGDGGYDGLGKA